MEKIPESLGCDVIKHKGRKAFIQALKNILIRLKV